MAGKVLNINGLSPLNLDSGLTGNIQTNNQNPFDIPLAALPRISVIIPVRNEVAKISACIQGILKQTIPVEEIIVIDSGSTDGTLEILRDYKIVRIIEIDPSEFNHGETRNLGARSAIGDLCLFTVGDASASDEYWIEKLLAGFTEDDVSAVCGMQIVPHERNKNPMEWFKPVSTPVVEVFQFSKDDFSAMSPEEQRRVCGWDDVTAMYKKSALMAIPFRRTSYAEDALWARDAILSGFKIAYNKAARVYHYHKADPQFAFMRSFTVSYHLYKSFGLIPRPKKLRFMDYLSLIKNLGKLPEMNLSEKWYWFQYNLKLRKSHYLSSRKFNELHAISEAALDSFHESKFSKPPVPLKN